MPRWTAEKFNAELKFLHDRMETDYEITRLAQAAYKQFDRKGYVKAESDAANSYIDRISQLMADTLREQARYLRLMDELLAMPDKSATAGLKLQMETEETVQR